MSGMEETRLKAEWTIETLDLAVRPEQLIPVRSATMRGLDVAGLDEPTRPSGEIESELRNRAGESRLNASQLQERATQFLGLDHTATKNLDTSLKQLDEHLGSDGLSGTAGVRAFETARLRVEQAMQAVDTATVNCQEAIDREKERRSREAEELRQSQKIDLRSELQEATTYLPPNVPVAKSLSEQLKALDQLTTEVTNLIDKGLPQQFNSAVAKVRQHHVTIGETVKSKKEAVISERNRRQEVLDKLINSVDEVAESGERSVKNLSSYMQKGAFDDITKSLSELKVKLQSASLVECDSQMFITANEKLTLRVTSIKTEIQKVKVKEEERRKLLLEKCKQQLNEKLGEYDLLKEEFSNAWSQGKPRPKDKEIGQLQKALEKHIKKLLSKKTSDFEKGLIAFTNHLSKFDDLYEFTRTEIQNGLDLKTVTKDRFNVERTKEDVRQKLQERSGAGAALKKVDESITQLLEQNRNTEALNELEAFKQLLDTLAKCKSAPNDANDALKKCGHFKITATKLQKALDELQNDDGSDLQALARRVSVLLQLTLDAKALLDKYGVVNDTYSQSRLRFDKVQAQSLSEAQSEFFRTENLNALDRFKQLTDKAVLDLNDFDKLVEPIEQGLESLKSAPRSTIKVVDKFKEHYSTVRANGKDEGYGTVTETMRQLAINVDQARQFADKVKELESQLDKVSNFEKLKITADGQFVTDIYQASDVFMQHWQLSEVDQELQSASAHIANFADLGKRLEENKSNFTAATTSNEAKAVRVVQSLLELIKAHAKKQDWENAKRLVVTLNEVSLAVTQFAEACQSARNERDKLKSELKDSDFLPIVTTADELYNAARQVADENTDHETAPYDTAKEALLKLPPVYQSVFPVATLYLAARTQCNQIAGLYPTESVDGPKEDTELKRGLEAALKKATSNQEASVIAYNDAAEDLKQLKKTLDEKQQQRRQAAREQLDNAMSDDKESGKLVSKLFESEAGTLAIADIFKHLKPAEIKSLLQGVDVDPKDKDKSKAEKCIVDLQNAIGGPGVEMLLKRLGTPTTIGAKPNIGKLLSDKEPRTTLLVDIHEQFKGQPEELDDMVTTGFGGDPVILTNIVKSTCGGSGEKLKALSDAFGTEKNQLKTMIDVFGPDECGDKLLAVVTKSYKGDVSKLKSNLYDGVVNDFNSPNEQRKLWAAAPTFSHKNPKTSGKDLIDKKELDLKGCGDVRIEHFLERHTRDFFNFGYNDNSVLNINDSNTQWPHSITKKEITDILQGAIAAVKTPLIEKVGGWKEGEYETKDVTINNVKVRIGIQMFGGDSKPTVAQFFPLSSISSTIKLEQFTDREMYGLAKAFDKPL